MKLDIGSRSQKPTGFLRLDNRAVEGVDFVGDINDTLPFPDHAAEFIMVTRSLAFSEDLFDVLGEIYRISMHKAIVCILAPYAHTYHHASNPHIRHKFDEHSPRYWTSTFYQPPQGPLCPEVPHYGGDAPAFDFRLLRMELFYLPPYRSPIFEEEELEVLQQLQLNVVDEIMYHLLVVKEEIEEDELDRLSRLVFTEPVGIQEKREVAADVE
ncbi:hypothetical protein ACX1C1_23380 [Paenibacillus sp. strain BS8-2]